MSARLRRDAVGKAIRMHLLKPALLVLQGFLLGTLLSVTLHPFAEPLPGPPPSTGAMLLSAEA